MKFPIIKAFSATLAYLASHAVHLLKALWLPALLLVAGTVWAMPHYLDAAGAAVGLGAQPNPAEAMAVAGPIFKWISIVMTIAAIFYPMLFVASLRHIVRGDELTRPFYLKFGGDELRVAGGYLLLVLLLLVLYFVYALAFGAAAATARLIAPAVGAVAAIAVGLVGVIGIFWFTMRLSLVFPASIATATLGVAQSWQATKGKAWRLAAFWFPVGLILMVLALLYLVIAMPQILSLYAEIGAAAGDPAVAQSIEQRLLATQRALFDPSKPGFASYVAATYLFTIVSTAILNTAAGTAWRYLIRADGAAA